MKSIRSLLIVLIAIIATVLFIGSRSVYAAGGIVINPLGNSSNSTNSTNLTNSTNRVNTTNVTNATTNRVNTTTNIANATTNNINSDLTKDLPKTGETDTYIIAGIGTIALVIGIVAFVKSREI